MSASRYPDHPLDVDRALAPIAPDDLLALVEPTFATTQAELLAGWRGLAPRIRTLFPLAFSDEPAPPNARIMRPGETAREALARVKRGVLVSIGVERDFGSLDRVDYEADPTGVNLEWPWQLNRLNGFWDLLAWGAEQGDTEARDALLGTVARWLTIPIPLQANGYASRAHRTIDTGIRLAGAFAQALPVILEHGDDRLLTDLLCSLFQQQERLRWNHRTNNWLTMEMNGLLATTAYVPFNRRSAAYRDYAIGMCHASLAEQLLPDHMQVELSPSYHMVCVHNFLPLVQRARALGVVDKRLVEIENRSMAMVRALGALLLSTGRTAEPQDSSPVSLARLQRYCPELQAPTGFTALPNAGYCVLRHGDASVFLDAGPYGASHQHQDKLNLIFTKGPRPGLIEYGTQTYEQTIWRKLCLSSAGHNCLLVDGTGQWRISSEEPPPYPATDFHLREDASGSSVIGRYDEAYGQHLVNFRPGGPRPDGAVVIDDVVHERAVHLLAAEGFAGCLLVEDRVSCRHDHGLTLLWHLNAQTIAQQDDSGLQVDIDGSPFALRWCSDHSATQASACGRHGSEQEHFLDGTPAGWSDMLDHDPRGGPKRPVLRIEVGTTGRSWHMLTLFAFDSALADLSVAREDGRIRLGRAGRLLLLAPRLD